MDRYRAMSVFAATVDAGSLSAAGRQLGMPLATVSRKISELESHLGARLLLRSTRSLQLTDAGQMYLSACRRILEDINEAERLATGEYQAPRGELIVTAPIVFGRVHVLPVVTQFLQAYPEINVRLILGDRDLNLIEDHIDAAVRVGRLPDSSLVATGIGRIRHVICASPQYLQARGTPKKPADLSRHDCITFAQLAASDEWTMAAGGRLLTVPVRSRLTVNTAEAAVDAAVAGAGLARVLSYQIAPAVREGRLKTVLKKFEPAEVPVNLVHAGQRRLPLKLRAFLDFATPRLRAAI